MRKLIGLLANLTELALTSQYLGSSVLVLSVFFVGLNHDLNFKCFSDLTANFKDKLFLLNSKESKFRISRAFLYDGYRLPRMIWVAHF